tara:strand:+ start:1263 stop:2873 length:1611 start_codon:yes stop_codon:yes gene_type:complete
MGSRKKRTRRKQKKTPRKQRIQKKTPRKQRIQKKTPRKQRAYMRLFKGGELKYELSGINGSNTLYMGEIPYTLLKTSGVGSMFGVKFFVNKQGEQIIVKEIPKGRLAKTASKNIALLELIQGKHDFIVRILDEGYVYESTQTRYPVVAAYMYAMEPCSGSLLPYVTERPVNTDVINGFLDAFNQLHAIDYVHGDIKPDNALLCNGVIKVGDIDNMFPNETSIKWVYTPVYYPYHMFEYHSDIMSVSSRRDLAKYLAEYPETYSSMKQRKLTKAVDRWAMGICVYEFYVGEHFKYAIGNNADLGDLCKRVHNDLCHYYVTGELPPEKAECFCLLDREEYQLDPSMEATMLNTMTEYCLSDAVKGVLDNVTAQREERQPEQSTELSTELSTRQQRIDLMRKRGELVYTLKGVQKLLQRYEARLQGLNDEKKKLNDKYQKGAYEYKPLLKMLVEAKAIYETKTDGEDPSIAEQFDKEIKEIDEKIQQITYRWDNIQSIIESKLAKRESEIKELNSLIEESRKNLDAITNELQSLQRLLE